MGKTKCRNPKAKPTGKQTWAFFCMTKQDIRGCRYTRGEVSAMIGELIENGETISPDNVVYRHHKYAPSMTVGAVLAHKQKRAKRSTSWAEQLMVKAHEVGQKALDEIKGKVTPMVVQQHANPLDDDSPVEQEWIVEGGPCGFAWVRVKCTNGPSRKFINQLKKAGLAGDQNSFKDWTKSDYYGGFLYSFTRVGGQSLAYKEAYAGAFARVLEDAGIDTYMFSRMD